MSQKTFAPHILRTEDVTPERIEALAERSGMKKQHLYMLLLREGLKTLDAHINHTPDGTRTVPEQERAS